MTGGRESELVMIELPEECPSTRAHMKLHLDEARINLAHDDIEQAAHDLGIALSIAENIIEAEGIEG